MRWRELEKLIEAGWLIGAHTRTHLYLGTLPPGTQTDIKIMWELVRCQVDIEQNLGVQARNFAYPNGLWNERTEQLVKQVFGTSRLFFAEGRVEYICKDTDPYRLPTMNISYQVSFDDFKKIVERTEPDFQLQLRWDITS